MQYNSNQQAFTVSSVFSHIDTVSLNTKMCSLSRIQEKIVRLRRVFTEECQVYLSAVTFAKIFLYHISPEGQN
jgi:hypothetical protein